MLIGVIGAGTISAGRKIYVNCNLQPLTQNMKLELEARKGKFLGFSFKIN